METDRQRTRRRFAFGALEQLANIFGAITASILTVGLFLPAIGAVSGAGLIARPDLLSLTVLVLAFTSCTAIAAIILRGLARLLEHGAPRQGMDG